MGLLREFSHPQSLEVAGAGGPRSPWVAVSRFRASKARGLGHSRGLVKVTGGA